MCIMVVSCAACTALNLAAVAKKARAGLEQVYVKNLETYLSGQAQHSQCYDPYRVGLVTFESVLVATQFELFQSACCFFQ